MRDTLATWIGNGDALRYTQRFGAVEVPLRLSQIQSRGDDYYISLVGELFDRMRNGYEDSADWARLGNAIGQFAGRETETLRGLGIDIEEAKLFSATAFYCGGYPASAYLTMKSSEPTSAQEAHLACYDFLCRPKVFRSETLPRVVAAVRNGVTDSLLSIQSEVSQRVSESLLDGPSHWIPERLLQVMLEQFATCNI